MLLFGGFWLAVDVFIIQKLKKKIVLKVIPLSFHCIIIVIAVMWMSDNYDNY